MSKFCSIDKGLPAEFSVLNKMFEENMSVHKVNLAVEGFLSDVGTLWTLPVVRIAEKLIISEDRLFNIEMHPTYGKKLFVDLTNKLVLGEDNPVILENRVFGMHTLSSTGGLRVGAEFLTKICRYNTIYVAAQTWFNHKLIFKDAGFEDVRYYKYWSPTTKGLHLEGLLEDLRYAPENSCIVLYCCGQKPTGCDPSQEQWQLIVDVIEDRNLFPIIDCAFIGLCTGDIDVDCWALRYIVFRGIEVMFIVSYAFNLCSYNDRIGSLGLVVNDSDVIPKVRSQFRNIVERFYSCPPGHGGNIIILILSNPQLSAQWKDSLLAMAKRLSKVREMLLEELINLETPGDWSHITKQTGLYLYTGLNIRQCQHLVMKYHIFLLRSGRANVCGITSGNVKYIAQGIKDAVISIPS